MKSVFLSTQRTRRHRQPNPELTEQEPFFSKSPQGETTPAQTTFFQPKLTIGAPNDPYEREADAVADKVVNHTQTGNPAVQSKEISAIQRLATPEEEKMPGTNDERMKEDKMIQEKPEVQRVSAPKMKEEEKMPGLQKKGDPLKEKEMMPGVQKKEMPQPEEEEMKMPGVQKMDASMKEEEKMPGVQKMEGPMEEEERMGGGAVQAKSVEGGGSVASAQLSSRIENSSGQGQSLPEGTRAEMESSFGVDFSGVNVHTGLESVEMNRDLGAQAFTHGQDVYFNAGKYSPDSGKGKHLLAHELTHVVQQGKSRKKVQEKAEIIEVINYPYLADKIHDAIAGLGTNEEAVYAALARLNHQADAIENLKIVYKNRHGSVLIDDLKEDFSGDELATALSWLKPSSIEAWEKEKNTLDYDAIAKEVHDGISGAGTDEEKVYLALGKLNKKTECIEALKQKYKEKYTNTLESDLIDDFSADELNLLLELIGSRAANEKVNVVSKEETEKAQKIIEKIWTKYKIDVNSQAGVDAILQFYDTAPQSVKDQVKAQNWEYKELVALEKALAYFDPILGKEREDSSRKAETQEITTVGKIEKGISKNKITTTLLGQYFRGSKNFVMYGTGTESTVDFPDNSKQLEGTTVHEIAHGLLRYALSDYVALLEYWKDEDTKSNKADVEAPITKYGGTNAREDLSEAVMYYFVEPETLKNGKSGKSKGEYGNPCPKRHAYIDKLVKNWNKK